jgi:hypothetical protein
MSDGAHWLSARQRSAGNTEYYFFIFARAGRTDRSADCLTFAQGTYLIHRRCVKTIGFVNFVESFFVEEKEFVAIAALKCVGFCYLLAHEWGDVLAGS